MADRTDNTRNEPIDFSGVPDASLLRAAADGELSPEGEARMARHLGTYPEDDRRVAFDRGLKDACGRAMGGVGVPQGLSDRVHGAIADQATADAAEEAAFADRIAARSGETRSPAFWNTGVGRAVAGLAAVLVLTLAGVYVSGSLSAPRMDEGYRVQLAQFVAGEHERVSADPAVAARKFVVTDSSAAPAAFSETLGRAPQVPVCDEGKLQFGGGSRCGVPGEGASTHFQFFVEVEARSGTVREVPVSVFVKRDKGEMRLDQGVTYSLDTASCGVDGKAMYVWNRDGLVYVMVARKPDDVACRALFSAMNVPPPSSTL